MNWDRIEGNWNQVKGKIREQWGKLTDDDLDRIAGKRDQLAGRLQERYGIAKDDVDREISQWETRHGDYDPTAPSTGDTLASTSRVDPLRNDRLS